MSVSVKWTADRLVSDVQGHVIELKKIFFSAGRSIDDDESHLHKFCVKLENILRFKQKEKYSFMGGRKDYWNFIQECLPKEETIKFVQSMPGLKTHQGKGRAFIRQALMEKTLADTLQRCIIDSRITRDWFGADSILVDERLCKSLIHCLYDLNSVDFELPNKGYDLDRAWPSFARRSFQGKERNGSVTSLSPSDLQNKRNDPIFILASKVRTLSNAISHPESTASPVEADALQENEVSMHAVIQGLSEVQYLFDKWNDSVSQNCKHLENELVLMRNAKLQTEQHAEQNLKELQGKYLSLGKLDSDAVSEKVGELYNMYNGKEKELNDANVEIAALHVRLSSVESTLVSSEERQKKLRDVLTQLEHEKLMNMAMLEKVQQDVSDKENAIEKLKEGISKSDTKLKQGISADRQSALQEGDVMADDGRTNVKSNPIDDHLTDLMETIHGITGHTFETYAEFKAHVALLCEENARNQSCDNENSSPRGDSMEVHVGACQSNADLVATQLERECLVGQCEKGNAEELLSAIENKLEEFSVFQNESVADAEDGLKKNGDKQIILQRLGEVHRQLIATMQERDDLKIELAARTQGNLEYTTLLHGMTEKCNTLEKKKEELQMELEQSLKQNVKVSADLQSNNKSVFDLAMEINVSKEKIAEQEKSLIVLHQHKLSLDDENHKLKQKTTELNESNVSFKEQLAVITDQLATSQEAKASCEEFYADQMLEMNTVQSELKEKIVSLEDELIDATGKAKELHDHLDNLATSRAKLKITQEQEVQGLRFQLSSEEMKHQAAVKALSEQLREYDTLEVRCNEQELIISDWKTKCDETMRSIAHERDDQSKMKTDQDLVIVRLAEVENEMISMEQQLIATTRQRDEEKSQRVVISRKLETTVADGQLREKHMTAAIERLENDVEVLKQNLVFVTKDKSELWMKSCALETELKQQSGDRWLNDNEADSCADCKMEFGLLVRRHHCRICGKIFCHSCSKNYVTTPHSKSKVRSCGSCHSHVSSRVGNSGMLPMSSDVDTDDSRSEASLSRAHSISVSDELTPLHGADDVGGFHPLLASPSDNDGSYIDRPQREDDDAYEILTEAEASAGYQEYESFTVQSSDVICDAVIPVVAHNDIIKETRSITVAARTRTLLPVVVGSSDVSLMYEISSEPKSIAFGIALKNCEEFQNAALQTIIPVSRHSTLSLDIAGKLAIDSPGTYVLVLDNLFARLSSKKVSVSVALHYSS